MDSSSGRNNLNSGSDSAKHYTGPASHQYKETPATPKSEVVTNRHPNGAVGIKPVTTPVPGSAVR